MRKHTKSWKYLKRKADEGLLRWGNLFVENARNINGSKTGYTYGQYLSVGVFVRYWGKGQRFRTRFLGNIRLYSFKSKRLLSGFWDYLELI